MDIIIGAGISGLSYAAKLSHSDYQIIEKDDSIGGYCRTIYSGSYIWDYAGHFFHFQHSDIKDFVLRNMDKDSMLTVEKKTQIYYKGKYIDYPFQMNIHQLEKEEFIDCLYDLFAKEDNDYLSFKEMLYCKFGKSIAEKFLVPYNEKLYATDLNLLDTEAMGRFFPYADKEEVILNFKNKSNNTYNSHFLYPKKGIIEVVKSIASRCREENISLQEEVLHIDYLEKVVFTNKRKIKYDNLISTTPLPKLLDLCDVEYDKSIYSCNKVLVFNLGFDKKGVDRVNNWVYFPESEYIFYRVGYYDNIIGQDKLSLYIEIGFKQTDSIDDISVLLEKVLDDLRKTGVITDHKLMDWVHIIMDPAYVHITKDSEKDKWDKINHLRKHNIHTIGRYGEWKYCSLEDNIFDAFNLIDLISKK